MTGAERCSARRTTSGTPSDITTPPPERITGKRAPASSSVAAARLSGPPGPRSTRERSRDRDVGLPVEQVARDVELGGAALEHGVVEAARQQLGDTGPCGQWTWYLVIFSKKGSCSVSWKPPRPWVLEPVSGVITTTGLCAQ